MFIYLFFYLVIPVSCLESWVQQVHQIWLDHFFHCFLIYFFISSQWWLFWILFFLKKYESSWYLFCDKKMIDPQRCVSHLSNNYCPFGSACIILTTSLRFVGALFFNFFWFHPFIFLFQGLTFIFLALFLWCWVMNFFSIFKI